MVVMGTPTQQCGTEMPQSRRSLAHDNNQLWVLKKWEKLHFMVPMANSAAL